MKPWLVFAILSAVFAGFTSVIAKLGLTGISGELGLAVRTVFVFVLVFIFAVFAVPGRDWSALSAGNFWWLGLSGVTTSLSWIFYYKALKDGEVSTLALI
ncbi:MAG: EamA family transporter, partial [Verrucomicrobia bacterium]|nr:EamA family transporter [Verrucomicrobiota bacterium]